MSQEVVANELRADRRWLTAAFLPLSIRLPETYIYGVGRPTMAINALWNKRSGPGGSTRRLHQFPGRDWNEPIAAAPDGGEIGSTRVVKAWLLLGMVPPLSGQPESANDNRLALAA